MQLGSAEDVGRKTVAVVVAHPDDESLWAGGTLLMHPEWDCTIVTLCRGGDADRAPRFLKALDVFGAAGELGDLDDGPEQTPLPEMTVRRAIRLRLEDAPFDVVITHGPNGEYTRHRRHEEACRAVLALWANGRISTRALWLFAYEDGAGAYLPRAIDNAHHCVSLPESIWRRKYALITETYGFDASSWEARSTPRKEAFWYFSSPQEAQSWVNKEMGQNESACAL